MLAGRMKLRNFVLIVVALATAAALGLYILFPSHEQPRPALSSAERAAAGERDDSGGVSPATEPGAGLADEPVAAAQPAVAATRDVDEVLLSYRGKALGADKRKDVTRGKPFKINLYQDAGRASMNRAKVDLDRDDKWDEKWTFDGERITRKVAPGDDENYTNSFVWDGTAWQPE